uniref:Ig-like domain-containing protein n=1 Tax=Astyanax mexicanus TaxID=7994 RepID=A0A3B1KBA1_ASTMX
MEQSSKFQFPSRANQRLSASGRRMELKCPIVSLLRKLRSLTLEMDEVTAKLGQTATLKCQIIGRPVPEIKWYKAGKEIKEGRKYAATSDGRNHTLTISTEQQEDEGLYTCKAVNEAGECETSGTLVLEAAPQFPVPLKDKIFAGCGTTVRIHVMYIGRPEPKIMWLHGSKPIEASENYHMFNMSGVLSLQIIDCQEEDSGTYRVVCTNAKGEASDYATLDVSGGGFSAYASQRKDEEPPTPFVPEMTKTDVYHVASAKATSATSETQVSETVTEIKSSEIKTAEITTAEITTAEIKTAEITTAEIKTETTETIVHEEYASYETKLEEVVTVEEAVVEVKKSTLPATILTKPQSLTVSEGESAKFTCDVDGEPAPSVTWMKEGKTIVSSSRHMVTSTEYKSTNNNIVSLVILKHLLLKPLNHRKFFIFF